MQRELITFFCLSRPDFTAFIIKILIKVIINNKGKDVLADDEDEDLDLFGEMTEEEKKA